VEPDRVCRLPAQSSSPGMVARSALRRSRQAEERLSFVRVPIHGISEADVECPGAAACA
jgi:hypothetical protein